MRDSISGIWLFQIVIAFILLFAGLMSVTMNKAKAFAVKNEIVNIVEKNNGVDITKASLPADLVSAMTNDSYRTVGKCPTDDASYQGFDREGKKNNSSPSICIKKISHNDNLGYGSTNDIARDKDNSCHFKVIVFYKLDLPVLKQILNFSLNGETKELRSKFC